MNETPARFADVVRPRVECGDPDALRELYRHVLRRAQDGDPVEPAAIVLLLTHLKPRQESDTRGQYRTILDEIEIIRAKEEVRAGRCTFYLAAKSWHFWLQDTDGRDEGSTLLRRYKICPVPTYIRKKLQGLAQLPAEVKAYPDDELSVFKSLGGMPFKEKGGGARKKLERERPAWLKDRHDRAEKRFNNRTKANKSTPSS